VIEQRAVDYAACGWMVFPLDPKYKAPRPLTLMFDYNNPILNDLKLVESVSK
jgi:hypothetical protein